MIKDFGSQKLERFTAGKALLDQVTAERLNDMCSMIEAIRLQTGVGYMLTRTPQGTTLNIADNEYSRPPKLWRITLDDVVLDPLKIASEVFEWASEEILNIIGSVGDFISLFQEILSSLVSAITSGSAGSATGIKDFFDNILNPINNIIDGVDSKIEELLNKAVPIQSTLENYFNNLGKKPQSGDMIYTDEMGICYTIFKEQEDDTNTIYPTQNLIFRVPFTLGSSENTQTYFALTTFPVPDIAEIVKTILELISKFITGLLGNSLEGLVQAILNTVAQALNTLYELILDLLKDLDIPAVDFSDLTDRLKDLEDSFDKFKDEDFKDLEDEFDEALEKLEDLLESISEVSWIDKDGAVHQALLPLSNLTTSDTTLRQKITWIDSSTGIGKRGEALIWNLESPNVDNVDWRDVEYIGADGNSYSAKLLTYLPYVEMQEATGKIEPTEVEVCEDGVSTTKIFLEKKQ